MHLNVNKVVGGSSHWCTSFKLFCSSHRSTCPESIVDMRVSNEWMSYIIKMLMNYLLYLHISLCLPAPIDDELKITKYIVSFMFVSFRL